jgi:hypothetical protein
LARAAAASSAVPVVLSSITIDNYGGTCGYRLPPWAKTFLESADPPRPAARTVKRLQELQAFADRENRPFLHLVDGGVSDNVGMRGVLDVLSTFEALHAAGMKTPYDHVRNVFVFVVNSLATPPNDWNQHENPPALFDVLIKATGTPIDRYSYDTVETLRDIQARWASLREVREAIKPYPALTEKLGTVMHDPGDRRFVQRAPGQGGTRLPQHIADLIRPRARSGGPTAGRRQGRHSGVSRDQETRQQWRPANGRTGAACRPQGKRRG